MTTYLSTHKKLGALASGALVFDPQNRLLLLQRAPHDSMPNRWEVPGGAIDAEDPTILHGVARELWEEAGLRAKEFKALVGEGRNFWIGRGLLVLKLEFWVEVEGEGMSEVRLDPNEHQMFVWASEEECRCRKVGKGEGLVEIQFTSLEQEKAIFEGFRLRKEAMMDEV